MEEKEDEINAQQEQIHNIVFSKEIGWQEIIYDLINTEQLDPWNIDITFLTNKYLEKIQNFEEANYFISSKVLLAAALLLRIKSEILLNKYMKSIDEILFGNKEKKEFNIERIELDVDEIPELIPKSPMPRFRRVTLSELVESLNKAIVTETRRIKKEIINRNALRETEISLPKKKHSIPNKIKDLHFRIVEYFDQNKEELKIPFHKIIRGNKEEKIISFSSILHLENQKKIWIEQKEHFGDIHIWLKDTYFKHNDPFEDLKELEEEIIEAMNEEEN
ncbi:MAG: segregation/condensation protein A [Nanoarchaeota archaeon]|nr:segregation/condensation protein A [Nanoarchaeota archaeon]